MGTDLSLWNYQLVGGALELGGRISHAPGSQQWRSEKQTAFVSRRGYVTALSCLGCCSILPPLYSTDCVSSH